MEVCECCRFASPCRRSVPTSEQGWAGELIGRNVSLEARLRPLMELRACDLVEGPEVGLEDNNGVESRGGFLCRRRTP